MKRDGKEQCGHIGKALAAWCLATLLLCAGASLFAIQWDVNARDLPWLSVGVLSISAAITGFVLCRNVGRQASVYLSGLCGLTLSAVLLMIGFIGFGDEIKLVGLIRIVLSCVIGAVLGGLLSGKPRRNTGKGKFVMRKQG